MKVKRYKRVQRILNFYKHNYAITPPYKVIIDGTFALAALQNKTNLKEQLQKYLDPKVEIYTTKCVVHELSNLGNALYGALHVCRQFPTAVQCHHKPPLPAARCLLKIAKSSGETSSSLGGETSSNGGFDGVQTAVNGAETADKTRGGNFKKAGKSKKINVESADANERAHYFFGTQDRELTEKLQKLPGRPVLFIKYMALLLEKPSEMSQKTAEDEIRTKLTGTESQKEAVRALKRHILGGESDDVSAPKRRKGPKGPNPLSCKTKKKKSKLVVKPNKVTNGHAEVDDSTKKRKKRRKRKSTVVL